MKTATMSTKPEDMAKSQVLADRFIKEPSRIPISFNYNGERFEGIPQEWTPVSYRRIIDANIVETVYEGFDQTTSLQLRVECTEYKDYPVIEWVAWFTNIGDEATPILSEILAMDAPLSGKNPILNHYKGDFDSVEGYEPFQVKLKEGETKSLAPNGGRSCKVEFPYYRILCEDCGYTIAVGWPGQWATSFTGLKDGIDVKAGQQTTSLSLFPGESVRTPKMTIMSWTGDLTRAINLWRRWYLAHILPKPNGQPIPPHVVGVGTGEGEEFTGATTENQLQFIERYKQKGLAFDLWWIDAGWYTCYNENHERRWWETGTWIPDPERFPNGMKPIGDRLKKENAKFLLWFEPERVRPGSELDKEHPEWLLKSDEENHLLNLGNPQCRQWITDRVCKIIQDGGIDVYRQDHNFPGLPRWKANDAVDRQGINENLHVQGYLQFWDDLLERNPGLWIDSCGGGGGRNDLETMRRSVPLHYTDHGYGDHATKLAFHRSLFEWIPYFKECTLSWDIGGQNRWDNQVDSFSFHCAMVPMIFTSIDINREDYDFTLVQKMLAVWRRVADLILHGDYYEHTPFHITTEKWVALQFDCPESGTGFIQGIRLQKCVEETLTIHPCAIDADAMYRFENPETGERKEIAGVELAKNGFTFALPQRSGAIWLYTRER
jgi:alpha-galactosidase